MAALQLTLSYSHKAITIIFVLFFNVVAGQVHENNIFPFEEVDEIPLFEKCDLEEEICERRNCVDLYILNFIKEEINKILKKQKQYMSIVLRTKLSFEIMRDGSITNVKTKGGDSEDLAFIKNIILGLPSVKPGKHKGKTVRVYYEIPIVLGNWPETGIVDQKIGIFASRDNGQNGSIKIIDSPNYPGCNPNHNSARKKECLSRKINSFVHQNFNGNFLSEERITGVNRVYVKFMISKCGNIIGIRARGPHPRLEEEVIRILKLLPKIEPAYHEDKAMNVLYSLPIVLEVK